VLEIDEAKIIASVKTVLPPGAVITRTERNVVPTGWTSERASGFLIEGRLGRDGFEIWFLPRDWIGIRKPDPTRARPNYWDGILADDRTLTITISSELTIPDRIRALGLSTPSLNNSGWPAAERTWKDRFAEAEATAEQLIAAHCPDRASRDEAAYSLVVLGVPAASVFRDTALNGSGNAKQFAITALGYFPSSDANVAAILSVLRDPKTPTLDRGYAAFSAETLAAPVLGGPLVEALGLERDLDARARIIRALARIRHAAAAPVILSVMEETDNPHYKAEIAGALASLRHREAAPAIRRLADGPFPAGSFKFSTDAETEIRNRARRALFVLAGDWGAPVDGLRFAIQAPATASAGPVRFVIFVENVGNRIESFGSASSGQLVVDGVARPRSRLMVDGMDSLHPNAVWTTDEDLLLTAGTHQVQYVNGATRSNLVTVLVK